MKKRSIRLMLAALAVTVVAGGFAGCSSKQEAAVSGNVTLAGSTALQPLAEQAGKDFTAKYPSAVVTVQGGGSGTGLNLVSEGTVNIGNSDVEAGKKLDASLASALVDHKVCGIGFAVVVNKNVKVDSLTAQQIQDIFTGKVTNWKEVGGQDIAIQVIHRPASSGTRATFVDTVMGGVAENDAIGTVQDSSGSVEKALTDTQGSISYLALSYITDAVKANVTPVKIDSVEATNANIKVGTYKFWSWEHMYTKGEATGATKTFLEYMVSADNKALVEKLGYISASDIK
ncbi:MAG TPA: phosphate ABC transporter substrate-binding protein [Clostridiaceae bacterium]